MGNVVGSILEPFTGARATRRAAEQAAEQQAAAGRQAAITICLVALCLKNLWLIVIGNLLIHVIHQIQF